ncbi:MAG: hypothetical protein KKH41_02150 [Candidatus Thermoplasmatota archaeon]|nr:hypothetical protein [Candidatus Thermoplasmatota archaeon]MBU4145093.1 hypothetical protein [Candidatus Thermoplasmatota archaeon]MBU4591363.1 hypothetical protein [Candidatus Thermoplasmatota archaeon]
MFKFTQWIHKPKFEQARDSGPSFDKMHEEQMHNMCELTERNENLWSAPLNH